MPNEALDREEIVVAVRGILASVLGVPVEEITLEASLEGQLGMDSLSAIEASIAVEERFDLKMPEFATPDELGLHTVADLVRLTSEKLEERRGS
jgi:acyl carrier protein